MKKMVFSILAAAFVAVPALAQGGAVCGWLSPAQVAGALGPGATQYQPKSRTESKNGITVTLNACEWVIRASGSQFGKGLALSWVHLDSSTGASAKELMDQTIQESQARMQNEKDKPTLTPLPGFGDEAYTLTFNNSPIPAGGVIVRRGNSALWVGLLNAPNAPVLAQALARSALAHMP